MTIAKFQKLLKKINPRLRIRQRGVGDVAGVFVGHSGKGGYICRMNKGELTMDGYRWMVRDPSNPMRYIPGRIKKRGRKTIINLLRNYRWVTNHKQRSMLTWGIEYSDDKVKGITSGQDQYS